MADTFFGKFGLRSKGRHYSFKQKDDDSCGPEYYFVGLHVASFLFNECIYESCGLLSDFFSLISL